MPFYILLKIFYAQKKTGHNAGVPAQPDARDYDLINLNWNFDYKKVVFRISSIVFNP